MKNTITSITNSMMVMVEMIICQNVKPVNPKSSMVKFQEVNLHTFGSIESTLWQIFRKLLIWPVNLFDCVVGFRSPIVSQSDLQGLVRSKTNKNKLTSNKPSSVLV